VPHLGTDRVAVHAAAGATSGLPAAAGLLTLMEAGVPIPIPADLVMLAVGERAEAGEFPLWAAVVALELVALVGTSVLYYLCRRPVRAVIERVGPRIGLTEQRIARAVRLIEARGRAAIAIGRGTPGLRTVTVVATSSSGIPARHALPFLVLGSSFFLQLHLVLGYLLGPAARELLDENKPLFVLAVVVLALVAAVWWVLRRGRRGGAQAWAEASCPACLALSAVGARWMRVDPGRPVRSKLSSNRRAESQRARA
jgi:membrane protein DedA with SNARE-associated domain